VPAAAEGGAAAPLVAAVLPHPPLLVPDLAGGAAAELDPLRAACREALAAVLAAAGTTVLLGGGPVWGAPAPGATGSFHPYGVDVEVQLPPVTELLVAGGPAGPADQRAAAPSGPPRAEPVSLRLVRPESTAADLRAAAAAAVDDGADGLPQPVVLDRLPLSLAVAAWLLGELDAAPRRLVARVVPGSLGPRAAAAVGRSLAAAARAGPVGLVVMADLSARRTERSPGAFHPEAAAFDGEVADAIRAGRPARLLELDPGRSAELLVGGRVPLQVLAGAAASAGPLRGRVLYEDAPYGVGYLVGLLTAP
jgi:hypothetical protein